MENLTYYSAENIDLEQIAQIAEESGFRWSYLTFTEPELNIYMNDKPEDYWNWHKVDSSGIKLRRVSRLNKLKIKPTVVFWIKFNIHTSIKFMKFMEMIMQRYGGAIETAYKYKMFTKDNLTDILELFQSKSNTNDKG